MRVPRLPRTTAHRILAINPNTSDEFTDRIREAAQQLVRPDVSVTVRSPASGPRSIESVYDELLSAPGTLALALADIDDYDGVVIACYSDHPAVHALREVTSKPVMGIAEASMYAACMVAGRFSVVTTNDAWEPLLWAAVRRYGLADRCASVRPTGLPVLALEDDSSGDAFEQILAAAERAVTRDGADAICLGCAGMAGLDKRLEAALGVPVLDGLACALKLIESLLDLGIHTSKRGIYARPEPKPLLALPKIFASAYGQPSRNGVDGGSNGR
jgi:allantoin racemase